MANPQEGSSRISFPSGFDFTSTGTVFVPPYVIVKLGSGGTAGKVVKSSASTDKHIGVLMNCPNASETADIVPINAMGTNKVICGSGGTIAVGNFITADSSGQAVATTSAGDLVIGICLEAAAVGQVFEYLPIFIKYA